MDSAFCGVETGMRAATRTVGVAGRGFDELYRRELPLQVKRATLLLGDVHAAQDVVHDAFIEVYRRWDALNAPGPYLSTAVLNRCRDVARRAKTRQRRLHLLVPDAQPEDEVLWDAVQELPFNHRAVVVLRFYHRMTEAEIAATLGCRPGSVGPWLHSALRRLRKELS